MKSCTVRGLRSEDLLVLVVGLDAGLFIGIVAWLVGRGMASL